MTAPRLCTTTCRKGQYCNLDDCKPCPNGSYQKEDYHRKVSCIPWTIKSEWSHYISVQDGSSTSDTVWRCIDGYEEKQYTVNGWECRKIIASTFIPRTTTVPVITSSSLPASTTANANYTLVNQGLNEAEVTAVVASAVVLAIALVCVLIWCWWKHLACFNRCWNIMKKTNNHTAIELRPDEVDEDVPMIDQDQHSGFSYMYFHKIVKRLGYDQTVAFLKVLEDPSKKFNFKELTKYNKEPEIYLIKNCQQWMKFNSKCENNQLFIKNALNVINCAHLFDDSELDFPLRDDMNIADYSKNVTQFSTIFKLSQYLVSILKVSYAKQLLFMLPAKFDMKHFLRSQQSKHRDFDLCFAKTLEEWIKRKSVDHPANCIKHILEEMDRNEILDNDYFNDLLSKIV